MSSVAASRRASGAGPCGAGVGRTPIIRPGVRLHNPRMDIENTTAETVVDEPRVLRLPRRIDRRDEILPLLNEALALVLAELEQDAPLAA